MTIKIACPGFTVNVPYRWRDVTESLEQSNCPFTLSNPDDGVGALQFSPAIYQSGPIPSPTTDDLAAMLWEFAVTQGLGSSIANHVFSNGLIGASASFHTDDDFIAVWYVSDGTSMMLVTYVCAWDKKHVEADAREAIVRSIRF